VGISNEGDTFPSCEVHLDFPFIKGAAATAQIEIWHPIDIDGSGDIAVLRLTTELPGGACIAKVLLNSDMPDRPFEIYGFPSGNDTGVFASVVRGKRRADGSIQIEDTKQTGFRVQPGFSGAPVWHPNAQGVVGMIVAAEKDPSTKVAYMIPASKLAEICNGLIQSVSHTHTNPFHTAGALPLNAVSYVERSCHGKLMRLIEWNQFTAIRGEYEVGKSTLLVRAQASLNGTYPTVIKDLNGMRTENAEVFTNELFQLFQQHIGNIKTWEELLREVRRTKLALLLDEFGALSSSVANSIIPKLHWLGESAGNQLRVVVAMPDEMSKFLHNRGVHNAKYSRHWHSITVPSFDWGETETLLNMLPTSVSEIARQHKTTIISNTEGHPRKIQCLCSRLFVLSQHACSESDIIAVILDPESYK
jgi:hypothetical protein